MHEREEKEMEQVISLNQNDSIYKFLVPGTPKSMLRTLIEVTPPSAIDFDPKRVRRVPEEFTSPCSPVIESISVFDDFEDDDSIAVFEDDSDSTIEESFSSKVSAPFLEDFEPQNHSDFYYEFLLFAKQQKQKLYSKNKTQTKKLCFLLKSKKETKTLLEKNECVYENNLKVLEKIDKKSKELKLREMFVKEKILKLKTQNYVYMVVSLIAILCLLSSFYL